MTRRKPKSLPVNTRLPIYLTRRPTGQELAALVRMENAGHRLRLRLRARVILLMVENPTWASGLAGLKAGYDSRVPGAWWVKRWNAEGLPGLEDRLHPGAPRGRRRKRRGRKAREVSP